MEKSPHCHSALPLIKQAKRRWLEQWSLLSIFSLDGMHMQLCKKKMFALIMCGNKICTKYSTKYFFLNLYQKWSKLAQKSFYEYCTHEQNGICEHLLYAKTSMCSVYMDFACICVQVSKCGAVAQLVCIDRSCVRYEGRGAICLTANLQRSGEWDQTGGKITPHTPKWETIIPAKVTQTQPRIKIIEQASSAPFPSFSFGSPPFSSPQRKQNKAPLFF